MMIARLPASGESLSGYVEYVFVSAVITGEYDRWCYPGLKVKAAKDTGHQACAIAWPYLQAGSVGSRHERSGMLCTWRWSLPLGG